MQPINTHRSQNICHFTLTATQSDPRRPRHKRPLFPTWKPSLRQSFRAGGKGRRPKDASLPGPPRWAAASNRWQERINKSQQTGISRCVSSCSKVFGLINGVAVHHICTTTPTVFLFRSYSKGGGEKKEKRRHLIIQSGACLRRDDWCRQLLTMWPRLPESDYHGNFLIREPCRLRGISLPIWYMQPDVQPCITVHA